MLVEWDEQKSRRNRAKHGVTFEEAQHVFGDPHAVSFLERIVEGEERWWTVGSAGGVVVLVVAHTVPDDEVIRIISARKATPRERRCYEETHKATN
jgi:uncharacterized DUF497 family protein